jgi:hypothetical protein
MQTWQYVMYCKRQGDWHIARGVLAALRTTNPDKKKKSVMIGLTPTLTAAYHGKWWHSCLPFLDSAHRSNNLNTVQYCTTG